MIPERVHTGKQRVKCRRLHAVLHMQLPVLIAIRTTQIAEFGEFYDENNFMHDGSLPVQAH